MSEKRNARSLPRNMDTLILSHNRSRALCALIGYRRTWLGWMFTKTVCLCLCYATTLLDSLGTVSADNNEISSAARIPANSGTSFYMCDTNTSGAVGGNTRAIMKRCV